MDLVLLLALIDLTSACNSYINSSTTYLCDEQYCDGKSASPNCRSGCCWDNACNADGECEDKDFDNAISPKCSTRSSMFHYLWCSLVFLA